MALPVRIGSRPLTKEGLLTVEKGHPKLTDKGRDTLSPMARKALQRPKDYQDMHADDQWAIDGRLGILDWDGT